MSKTYQRSIKDFLQGKKPGLFVNFGQFPWTSIRMHIPNADPDLGQSNQCGFGSTILFLTRPELHHLNHNHAYPDQTLVRTNTLVRPVLNR